MHLCDGKLRERKLRSNTQKRDGSNVKLENLQLITPEFKIEDKLYSKEWKLFLNSLLEQDFRD